MFTFFLYFLFICRAYDRAAIKFRGVEADINFTLGDYEEDMKQVWSFWYVYICVWCVCDALC